MAIFINNIPQDDPNVKYNGKVYPQDKQPIASVPVNPNVNYNGQVFPRDKVAYQPPAPDPLNQPSIIKIAGVQLPPDTLILLDGKKIIARDTVIDGVTIFEHIARAAYEVEFDIVIREEGAINGFGNAVITEFAGTQPFPQQALNTLFKKVWLPDTVVTVENTYLNGLGILELIIEEIRPMTVRGSKNIPVKMKCYENVPGTSIIITNESITL